MLLCLLGLSDGLFLVQCAISWSDIPNSITPHWLIFWKELVKTRPTKVEILLVTLVGIELVIPRKGEAKI